MDIRGSYIAVFDPASKFFREWSVYTSHGGATLLPEIREVIAGNEIRLAADGRSLMAPLPIYGADDPTLATRILELIATLAKDPDYAEANDKHITTKLIPALIAVCKFRPHFLLRLIPEGVAVEHIDVAEEAGPARAALMAKDAEIRAIAPPTFRNIPQAPRISSVTGAPVTRQRERGPPRPGGDSLGLYSHILPTLFRMKKRGDARTLADMKIEELSTAMVFDCRGLPIDFLADTGDATFEEMQATHQPVRLPSEFCYFEFDREIAILADTSDQSLDGPVLGNIVDIGVFKDWLSPSFAPELSQPTVGEFYNDFTLESYNEWMAHFDGEPETEVPFFELAGGLIEDIPAEIMHAAARLFLGVLTLLQDKLVISSQLKSDPRPWLTDHRRLRGQPPKAGDVRVLTLNVPAIRNEAKRTPLGTHESPALHWRRGHWRTLHRATDAETRTWIRKCLVGDPERGYIAKNYRLTVTGNGTIH